MKEIKFKRAFYLGAISACFFWGVSLPFELEFNSSWLAILLVSSLVFFIEFCKENKALIMHIYKIIIDKF
ncbi:hypothetical protein ACE1BS_00070 [Aeromonas jandaei]|nr:hypothetical protein CF104_20270 [Aeromonas jandaei]